MSAAAIRASVDLVQVQRTGRCPGCGLRFIGERALEQGLSRIVSFYPAIKDPPGKGHRQEDCTASAEVVRGDGIGRHGLLTHGESFLAATSKASDLVGRAISVSNALHQRAEAARVALCQAKRICDDGDPLEAAQVIARADRHAAAALADLNKIDREIAIEHAAQQKAREIRRREDLAVSRLAEAESEVEVAKVRKSTMDRVRAALSNAFGSTRDLPPAPNENDELPISRLRNVASRNASGRPLEP